MLNLVESVFKQGDGDDAPAIRTDRRPEFTGEMLDQWAYEHCIELKLIQVGKPTQNTHIESFNGKLRDECPNEHWFHSLDYARAILGQW